MARASDDDEVDGLGASVRIGEKLDGKWVLEAKLGQGGMGAVYLARDIALDRKVAIKIIAADQAASAEVRARFERESRLMAKLDHPNLVPVYAVARKGLTPFIVMKHLDGVDLSGHLRDRGGRLSWPELRPIAGQVCSGLAYMHAQGLVHRDLKPGNIFIGPDGHVTILDLGVARTRNSNLTRTGAAIGTPKYMSPEQILGERELDLRSDIYSLGAVLFRALTGVAPFEDTSDHRVMLGHCTLPPPDPLSLAPELSPRVAAIVLRCLAKAPDQRFRSADKLWEALAAGGEGESVAAGTKRDSKRRRSLLIVAALSLTAGGLFWAQRSGRQRSSDAARPVPLPAPFAALADAGASDAADFDAGTPDAGSADAGVVDAGQRSSRPEGRGELRISTITPDGDLSWASVSVDGVPHGSTPVELELPAGRHRVEVTRPGYRSVTRVESVRPARITRVTVSLVRQ